MTKQFFAVVLIVVAALGGIYWYSGSKKDTTPPAQLGTQHSDQGNKHIAPNEPHDPYNSDLPSSGPHYSQPAPWGVYEEDIPPEVFVHNLEHGGIVVTYRPDLSPDQLALLKNLLTAPFSRQGFSPTKVLLFPRASNTNFIQIASWTRTFNLDSYDENLIVEFYLGNVGKSPEPTAP